MKEGKKIGERVWREKKCKERKYSPVGHLLIMILNIEIYRVSINDVLKYIY